MAPYTIAHLKLSTAFKATGFKHFNRRLGIYLTNSLEESESQQGLFTGFGFAESIAEESKEAALIKNETPIMVVIGNPPYSVSSENKSKWILELIKDYKKNLGEKKINIDDDYIKFIRLAEYFVEKNKTGIVAMITNNSFIDGITHRQMRKHLLETFTSVYIVNLHGDSNKKEKAPDGDKDENVFDIMQGVSISIFIKNNDNKIKMADVNHAEIYGTRENKFSILQKGEIKNIKWEKINCIEPYYFFVPKDFELKKEYNASFAVTELLTGISGIETKRDHFAIDFDLGTLKKRISDFIESDYKSEERKTKFSLRDNEWVVDEAVKELRKSDNWQECFYPCLTRPFDVRWIIYNKIILARDRGSLMAGMNQPNYGLVLPRQTKEDFAALITDSVCTHKIVTVYDRSFIFPLYLYSEDGTKVPNLKKEIVEEIEKTVGKVTPEDILDYIYAVLHSPSYREKYKEFLKIDFPRVPYPKDKDIFKKLVKLGTELRSLHLLESPKVNQFITTYPVSGNNEVEKVLFKDGKVFINKEQYFGKVPEIAWNFYIGGYQPAQKWLKDRKGRTVTNSAIEHYQKIIVALTETDRIMKEIDKVISF
jgi:predicted helicase